MNTIDGYVAVDTGTDGVPVSTTASFSDIYMISWSADAVAEYSRRIASLKSSCNASALKSIARAIQREFCED